MAEQLHPSSLEKVTFSAEVEAKMVKVFDLLHKKGFAVQAGVPKELDNELGEALKLTRQMHRRYSLEDLRHSEAEVEAEQEIAAWLIKTWHKLKGTNPPEEAKQWTG